MFYVLLVGFVIQAEYTIGKCLWKCYCNRIEDCRRVLGVPVDQDYLKKLVRDTAKFRDCARSVPYSGPVPIRFRRTLDQNSNKFGCLIKLD